jgi:cytidyltransferase-like protein
MKKVFVSGCYDILHAGHIEFFLQARALGDCLTVSFASSEVLWHHKQRRPSIPDEHKKVLLESLRMVDAVVIGQGHELGLDFKEDFLRLRPDILAVTTDDKYEAQKRMLCAQVGAQYVVLEKTLPKFQPISTSEIVRYIRAPYEAPLRVDFAGGWLDVPRFSRVGAFIVNCAISPTVSLASWPYERNAGLGGSGAWALLNGFDGVTQECDLGVGWQDPAVIREGGLCVWRSGQFPDLLLKRDGKMLNGRMALYWTGVPHDTPRTATRKRDYDLIETAGHIAAEAVEKNDFRQLAEAVRRSYQAQIHEGMELLPQEPTAVAWKYCGGGWGGYALYLFDSENQRDEFTLRSERQRIEPYPRCW